jgi:hypothetical protein
MFSTKVVEGASRVAEAVDLMADSSAPKNATCSATGMCSITRVGSTFCGSSASRPAVPGMTSSAAMTTNMGTKANAMYSSPPITGPRRVRALLADITRWNTSCCGMEPSIMVMAAAKKKVHFLTPPVGKNWNLPSRGVVDHLAGAARQSPANQAISTRPTVTIICTKSVSATDHMPPYSV